MSDKDVMGTPPSPSSSRCTDTPCGVLFLLLVAVWGVLVYYALKNGDSNRLLQPYNYNGDRCGEVAWAPVLEEKDFVLCMGECPGVVGEVLCHNVTGDCFMVAYSTVAFLSRCVAVDNTTVGGELFYEVFAELRNSLLLITLNMLGTVLLSILWVWLMSASACAMYYVSIFGIFAVLGLAAWSCWEQLTDEKSEKIDDVVRYVYVSCFVMLCIAVVLYSILTIRLLLLDKIHVAARVTSVVMTFITSSTTPLVTFSTFVMFLLVHCGFVLYVAVTTSTMVVEKNLEENNPRYILTANGTLSGYNITTHEVEPIVYYILGVNGVIFLWGASFLQSAAFCMCSHQVTGWYFSQPVLGGKGKSIPSYGVRQLTSHFGSVVLGSFLSITVGWAIDVMNICKSRGRVLVVDKSVYCVMSYLERVSFFKSLAVLEGRYKVQFYEVRHVLTSSQACNGLGKAFIASVTTVITWTFILDHGAPDDTVQYGVFVLAAMWVTSFMSSTAVLSIIDVAAKSLLTLYFIDQDSEQAAQRYAPPELVLLLQPDGSNIEEDSKQHSEVYEVASGPEVEYVTPMDTSHPKQAWGVDN